MQYLQALKQRFKNIFFLFIEFVSRCITILHKTKSQFTGVNKKKYKVFSARRLNKEYWRERTRTRPDYWYGYIFRFFSDFGFWFFRWLVRIWLNLLLFLEIAAFINIIGIFVFIVVVGGGYIFLKFLTKIVLPVLLWKLFSYYFPQKAKKYSRKKMAIVGGRDGWLYGFLIELVFGCILVFTSVVFVFLWVRYGENFLDLLPIVLVEPVFIDDINAVYIFL